MDRGLRVVLHVPESSELIFLSESND
jgi:hypothetical protein